MKAFVVCALFGLAAANSGLHHPKWASFKAEHGKDYHPSEEAKRSLNFAQTHDFIEEHNAKYARGEVSYFLGHNRFSDMTHDEVKAKFLGKKALNIEGRNTTELPASNMPSLPASVDWRSSGIVTTPKDQSGCGSCYSFGTIGVIESAIATKTGEKLDLSEQQLVDCSYGVDPSGMNSGCEGGHEVIVMDWVNKYGVTTEQAYSYKSGGTGTHYRCNARNGKHGMGLKYKRINAGSEARMADAIANNGPLVISISGENRDFQMFRGGIYSNPNCPQTVDHVISLVGYGTERGQDYWIVKNSWGVSWGEGGFGKVKKGVNQCGIVSDHSWFIYY